MVEQREQLITVYLEVGAKRTIAAVQEQAAPLVAGAVADVAASPLALRVDPSVGRRKGCRGDVKRVAGGVLRPVGVNHETITDVAREDVEMDVEHLLEGRSPIGEKEVDALAA